MQETTQRPLYVFMVVDKGIPSSQADEATFHNALQYLTTILTAGSGQREPPRLVLEVGGTSALQAWMTAKLKSPLLGTLRWGTSSSQAWLPAKLKSSPLQAQV